MLGRPELFGISYHLEQKDSLGQDALYVGEMEHSILFCLADRVGGISGGAEASSYVVSATKELLNIQGFSGPDDFESFLRKLDLELSLDTNCGETTAIVGTIQGSTVTGASVGDSKA